MPLLLIPIEAVAVWRVRRGLRASLRHAFATWHRQAGTPTHELQRLGGWKTGSMVERYAHVAPEALQGAAARLDALGSNVLGYVDRSRRKLE